MVIKVRSIKRKRPNYFMTTEEAMTLWYHAKRKDNRKFLIMLGLALFRGLRISEICAMQLKDFTNFNFKEVDVILSKSHIKDKFPVINDFAVELKSYVLDNAHLMKNGYLFPTYSTYRTRCMTTQTADTYFHRIREELAANGHINFLDKATDNRYRICWHSCRRWFETYIYEIKKDKMYIRDIMRYQNSRTVDVYIDSYEIWKNEGRQLEQLFGSIYKEFNMHMDGQQQLTAYT